VHVHVSALSLATFIAQLLVAGFLIRLVQIKFPDSTLGKALGVLY
jgi:hypothetical protein